MEDYKDSAEDDGLNLVDTFYDALGIYKIQAHQLINSCYLKELFSVLLEAKILSQEKLEAILEKTENKLNNFADSL